MESKNAPSVPGPVYEVVWPLGRSVSTPIELGPPISDLNGKTIGEVWDLVFRGDEMFPIIRESLRQRFPDVKFVDYHAFGNIHGREEREVVAALPRLLRQNGCDAVIVGVGN